MTHGIDEHLQTDNSLYLVPCCICVLHSCIPVWKELTHHAKRSFIHGILVITFKYGKLSPKILHSQDLGQLYITRVIGDPSVINLTFREWSLVDTPSVLFVGSSPFILQVHTFDARVDNSLTNDFVHHQGPSSKFMLGSHTSTSLVATKYCMKDHARPL